MQITTQWLSLILAILEVTFLHFFFAYGLQCFYCHFDTYFSTVNPVSTGKESCLKVKSEEKESLSTVYQNTIETPYKLVSNTSKYGAATLPTLFFTAALQLRYQNDVKLLAWLKTLFQREKKAVLTVKSDKQESFSTINENWKW